MAELQKKVGKYITVDETLDLGDDTKLEGKKRKNGDDTIAALDQNKVKKGQNSFKRADSPTKRFEAYTPLNSARN